MIFEERGCTEQLTQCAYALDIGVDYSRKVDGHSGLQEIAELVKFSLQQQANKCEHCKFDRRDPVDLERLARELTKTSPESVSAES